VTHRQFFVFVLAMVYYLLSLLMLFFPLWFSGQHSTMARLYADMPSQPLFSNLITILIILHLGIIVSMVLMVSRKTKTGLWMLVAFGGIWLALQLTRVEDMSLVRSVAEMFILTLCVHAFAKRKIPVRKELTAQELAENEQQKSDTKSEMKLQS